MSAVSAACPAPGRSCPPGPTGLRPFRPALRGRAPPPRGRAAPSPHQRGGHGPHRDAGTRGQLAPPALQARRAPPPSPGPSLAGQRSAGRSPPRSPHIIGVPARELADILVHVLEAFLGFLQLLLQRTHRHRHPARARPGRAPREAALGNRGDGPRPLRRPRARTAQPIAPRWPPLTANHRARGEGGTPARVARQKRSPITEPRGRLASRPPN